MADRVITNIQAADHRLSQISTASSTNSKRAKAHVGPWQLGRTLGRGSSGRVRLAKHVETGKLAAVKIVPKAMSNDSTSRVTRASESYGIEREVIIMKLIEHPNIMGLFDVWENKGELYLVLEYIEGGELFDYLISRGRLSEREAIHYFRQICYGVDYCHQFNICHRDLKPENLLLDKHRNIKIADFGMAALEANGRLLETSCGSPHYASPEIVSGKNYHGAPSDIWSCGIILFALLTGHLPFDDDNIRQLLLKVQAGKYTIPSSLSSEARDLISRMLVVDPTERIGMRDILNHPLLRKYPPRNIPLENMEKKMLRIDVRQQITHIDREILRNLQTLWPHCSRESLIAQLRKPESNTEKIFYALLVRFRQRHGLSSRDSLPRNKSGTSLKSMRSSKSTRSLTSLTTKPGSMKSMKSLKSVRSSRSARSIMSTRRRRSPTKAKTLSTMKVPSAGNQAKHPSPNVAKPTHSIKTSLTDQTDNFAQILDQAFNQHSPPDPETPVTMQSSLGLASDSNTSDRLSTGNKQSSNGQDNESVSTRRKVVQKPNTNGGVTTKTVTTSVPLVTNGASPKSTAKSGGSVASNPFDGFNTDFDFSNTSFGFAKSSDTNYLLPMIFEEDRFADAIEEEMEQKINMTQPSNATKGTSRSAGLRSQPGDDSHLRITNLVAGESFLSYQPSPAAAAISAPVREAPKAPKGASKAAVPMGPRDLPVRKPVAVYTDSPVKPSQTSQPGTVSPTGARAPLAPLSQNEARARSTNPSSHYPDHSGSPSPTTPNDASTPLPNGESPDLGDVQPLRIRKRNDSKPPQPASPATPTNDTTNKEKPKSSWIRRLTPRLGSRKNSKNNADTPTSPRPSEIPITAPPTLTNTARQNSQAPARKPDRSNAANNKENILPYEAINQKVLSPQTWATQSHAAAQRVPSNAQPVEEPRQNWFMKMLSSSTHPSSRTIRTSCQSIELRAVILELLSEWRPYGLTVYNDGLRGDPIVVVILRSNSLNLKSARIGLDIRPGDSTSSTVKLVLQKGSRTSFTAFYNETFRRLQESQIVEPSA